MLPHRLAFLFPMYLLHLELCKGDKKELDNLTFYRFVISVHWPTKAFHNEEREKYNPNHHVEKQVEFIAHLPDSPTMLTCSLPSFFHSSLYQVFLELFIHLGQ